MLKNSKIVAYIHGLHRHFKLFIRAERVGNWNMHIIAVGRRPMLNLFAATGHFNYAKRARMYLQLMLELPAGHPWLYEQFTEHGYHTVRRSDLLPASVLYKHVTRSVTSAPSPQGLLINDYR